MHPENATPGYGYHFGGLLSPRHKGENSPSPVILLLDPTPGRMATALDLAGAGWLPVSANTGRADCLDLALLALSLPPFNPGFAASTSSAEEEEEAGASMLTPPVIPSVIVMEATHPLLSTSLSPDPFATPFRRNYRPACYPSSGEELNLSAQELAGRLAALGLSPLEIPFILYTTSTRALLTTPTRWPSSLSRRQESGMPGEGNDTSESGMPEPTSTAGRYFSLVVERRPGSTLASPTTPRHEHTSGYSEEDPLLAVMAYLSGIYLCRNCKRQLAPVEQAHLAYTLQLWCGECSASIPDPAYLSLSPALRLLKPAPSLLAPAATLYHQQEEEEEKALPEHYRPPLFPARLLAKAAFTLVTGSLNTLPDPPDLENCQGDPWNSAQACTGPL